MTEEIIIDGTFDVSKGNQKYAKKYSPVEDWYKAENNMLEGINVAECVHFTRQYNYGYCELSNDSCNEFQCNCAKNKNCYYKQLKRLEQENKELKTCIEMIKNTEGQAHIEGVRLAKENKNYRSALEEIRVIADDTLKVCDDDCGNARKIKLIIDKINEY